MPCRLVFLLLLTYLSSCAVSPTDQHPEAGAFIGLAPPIAPSRRVVQQLTAIWPGKQENLLCVLELDSQRIAIAGLSPEGISLFNLTYTGDKLLVDNSPLLPVNFSPEHVIQDLQLAYWPLAELKKLLRPSWRLEADSQQRQLYFNHEKNVDVKYLQPDAVWPKTVELTNHRYHYQLHIKTVSYESIPE